MPVSRSPNHVIDPSIGTRVTAARERLGWTKEALAFHAELSHSAVAQVESGRRTNVRPHTLSALSQALGVTIDYLVHGGPPSSTMLEHRALLYETDQELADTLGPFLAQGIERSEAVLAVTTKANVELLREYLGSDADRVEFVDAKRWYSAPGAVLGAYEAFVRSSVETGAPWVRIVGEPVWSGRSDSEIGAWTRYESLFNLVFGASPVSVVCPYDTRSVPADVARQALCTHPHTIGSAGIESSPEYADPGGFVLDP
jgi:transcriptional regulator with XRE-family HTH domain